VVTDYTALGNRASIIERVRSRAPGYWRYVCEQPSWIFMFLFARTLVARRIERWLNRAAYRAPAPANGSILDGVDLPSVVADLIRDGVHLGLRLPPHLVREIRAFADTTPCFSRDNQTTGFLHDAVAEVNRLRERDVVAAYYFESVERSPAIVGLAADQGIRSVAAAYLGHDPVLIRIRLWWSFPAERVSDADLHAAAQDKYHFDLNAWRSLKFFFYLTATNEEGGPHRCIMGSHRRRSLRHQLTLTVGRDEEELRAFYDADRLLTVTGEEGAGFTEDPFVFHTGSLCRKQPRLILELEYGHTSVTPSYRYGRLG